MSEAMRKRYGSNGLADKPRSDASGEIVLDAEEITERLMQKMSCGESKRSNILNFTGRVNQEQEPKGNLKQYGVLID